MTEMIIAQRHRGPAHSGNGGYTAGALAALLGSDRAPVEVTLRKPPPLETPLHVREAAGEGSADAGLALWHGDALVAEARWSGRGANAGIDPVEPVPYDAAVAASAGYPGLRRHPFPTCFACGTERSDGLRIFPGPVAGTRGTSGRVAAPWTPGDDVDLPTTWAALDCIGGWAGDLTERLMVLGRMTAMLHTLPRPGEPHVVMGLGVGPGLGTEGRRTTTAATLYDPDGRIVGRARHVWVTVDPARFNSQAPA